MPDDSIWLCTADLFHVHSQAIAAPTLRRQGGGRAGALRSAPGGGRG